MTYGHITMISSSDSDIQKGWAVPGELVILRHNKQLFKITKVMKVNYQIVDEDGKLWKAKFSAFDAAPEGTVWGGPAEKPKAAVKSFEVGTVVRVKGAPQFPHAYVVTKQTSDTRYKLQAIGHRQCLTVDARSLVEHELAV